MNKLLAEQYDFRFELVERLTRDLVGPQDEEEILDDAPIEQYIAGVLYPQSADTVAPEQDLDTADEDDETGNLDPPVSLANRRYPSSMGMTFSVDPQVATSVVISASAARYEELPSQVAELATDAQESSVEGSEDDEGDVWRTGGWRRTGREGSDSKWRRVPLNFDVAELDVTIPVDHRRLLEDGLELFCRVRPADESGSVPVTLALVNKIPHKGGLRDASSFFQPQLEVTAIRGGGAPFVERPSGMPPAGDEDLNSYRLIYRHARNFGTGHGCAVEWKTDAEDESRATSVSTAFVPRHELLLADSNPDAAGSELGMRFFSQGAKEQVTAALDELIDGYADWIETVADEARSSFAESADLTEAALRHIKAARKAVKRMRRGVRLLETDARAWNSFRLMNEAMQEQRARADWIRRGSSGEGPTIDDTHQWRPFQIAFILMCLNDIVEASSLERREVDLLWFPTGGGKTEAYLGLIAFTVFHRRLRDTIGGAGVTALMRYTLRLLTIQQFERATSLIAACEQLRRRRDDLGAEPISIGLWVGQAATPNTLEQANAAIRQLWRRPELEEGNPVQLRHCPWCGTLLDHENYFVRRDRSKMVIACKSSKCEFEHGLPVYVIDEDIYKHRPTLLIGTVDKFASLPWREETSALFNLDHQERPPELIVQDELHLISGPLGTLTGLYETAVDALATHEGAGPKVIASTATIRRAGDQVRGLFARGVNQFPPPGIDARNSYFAVEAPREERGTRLYVGVCSPGTSQTTLLIRTYASLLQAAGEIPGSNEARDPYWTLVGYFNSLRVLGAATIQVRDDVADRVSLLAARTVASPRKTDELIELTSREQSTAIPDHLKHMEVQFPNQQALDLILATNMISVGVDVDRLGLMVVAGQPQSTSEYIQSTSRVGRQHPGLVVTMLNAAKSRDRSHYESFVGFHSSLYRQVEASSVTPFSPRARDRGLHAVLIGLIRMMNSELRSNDSAAEVTTHVKAIEMARQIISERAEAVDDGELEQTMHHLTRIVEEWNSRATVSPNLKFRDFRSREPALLIGADDLEREGFPTLWSLRDVDSESNLYLE